jgi:hypothetical protein
MNDNFWSGFKKGFHEFGDTIKNSINFILLLFAYIIGVGFSSILVRRIMGKKFMRLYPEGKSNWTKVKIGTERKEEYYRQF